ncbi:MAG TPA: hypothetical protein V6C99_09145 [Oculatellaceae cyanobacterium]
MQIKFTNKARKGQGVIEYAGALVIAALLVAAVISLGPDAIENLFTNILTSVQNFFQGQLPGA